jgi:hypothetical protein
MASAGPAQAVAAGVAGDSSQGDLHPGMDETVSESVSKQVFATYVCKSVQHGQPHPGDIAESSSLAAVPLPKSTYPLWDAIPEDIISSGKLSQLQLEGVLYAWCVGRGAADRSTQRLGRAVSCGRGPVALQQPVPPPCPALPPGPARLFPAR